MPDNNFNDEKFTRFTLDDDAFEERGPSKDDSDYPAGDGKHGSRRGDNSFEERDYHPVRQRRDGRTGFLGGFMYFIFVVSISVILACLGWMAASDVLALNKDEVTAEVVLSEEFFSEEEVTETDENGVTTKKTVQVADIGDVATALKDAGIIEYKALFRFYSSISSAKYKIDPGTYELSTIYDYRAIVKKMQFGSDSQVRTMVTFREGLSMKQIFELLEENRICKVKDLMECAATHDFGYRFLEDIPYGDASRLEGFLFPDTYEFYQGMTAQAAIDTFLQIFHYKLTAEMWELAEAKGFTMRDVVNMASLIEKEAANDEERLEIAGIIYNRLNGDWYLGVDAAIIYVLPDFEGELTGAEFEIDSPYNLRKYKGLPPTPICSPGMASIMAVLKPNTTNNYFYALDESSTTTPQTHRFFTNLDDFNAFVATQSYGG